MRIDVQTVIDQLPEPIPGKHYQVLGKIGSMSHVFWLYELNPNVHPRHRAGLYRLSDREAKYPYSRDVQVGRAYEFNQGEDCVFHREVA